MLSLLGQRPLHFDATFWAESVSLAQSRPTPRAGEPNPGLKVLDGECATGEVYVFYLKSQRLADTATEVKEHPNQKSVPKAGCCSFQFIHIVWFQICSGHRLVSTADAHLQLLRGFASLSLGYLVPY